MRRSAWAYTGVASAVSLGIALLTGAFTEGAERVGAWFGISVAWLFQVVVFWLLSVRVLPARRLLAYGLGMIGRLLVLGLAGFLWVPLAGLPAAPTLLSLVAVFFATTLLEPVFFPIEL